jgi:hypothetical protein
MPFSLLLPLLLLGKEKGGKRGEEEEPVICESPSNCCMAE